MKYFFLFFIFLNCTTVGFHDEKLRKSIDFGEIQKLKVCVMYEKTININEVKELELFWHNELNFYKINLEFSKIKQVDRIGFWGSEIINELNKYKLSNDCNRILYLVGREWSDIGFEFFSLGLMFGIGIKAEIQGAVEGDTNTRGYIKAKYISTLQLLFTSPKSTLVHEGYHLLGCGHALFKDECYIKINSIKKNNSKRDFFGIERVDDNYSFDNIEFLNKSLGSFRDF